MSTQRVTDTGSTPARLSTVKGIGLAMGLAGVALTGWGMLGGIHSHAATPQIPVLFTDPGCTPSAAGPGVVTVCLHESQEGTTASAFADHSCDNIDNRNSLLDYFVFVLPAAGDSGRTFTSPAPTVYFDTGSTSGTIGSNAKFFYASALPGTTLLEAVAHADNGTGTPTGGEAQSFNLTHTCPASVTSSTTSTTGTVSGTSTSQSSTATSTSSSTGTVSGTSTSQSSTGTVSGTSTSTSTSPSTTTETSTVTSTGTVSGTTTTTSTSPTTTTATTTVTSTGTVSGTSTSTVTSTVTSTSTVSGTSTTQSSSTGGVSGVSTTNTTSSATGGVQGITSPNTGADAGGSVLAGLLLMSGGATILGVGSRRSRTRR